MELLMVIYTASTKCAVLVPGTLHVFPNIYDNYHYMFASLSLWHVFFYFRFSHNYNNFHLTDDHLVCCAHALMR